MVGRGGGWRDGSRGAPVDGLLLQILLLLRLHEAGAPLLSWKKIKESRRTKVCDGASKQGFYITSCLTTAI